MSIVKPLIGHSSPETAFIIPDYPAGFKSRCVMRVWIETTKNGQRVVRQTSSKKWDMPADWKEGDPVPADCWNAPKRSTYSMIRALYLDEAGHVQTWGLDLYSGYSNMEIVEAFERDFADLIEADVYTQKQFEAIKAYGQAYAARRARED
jgi:hypothetical protein